MEDNNIVSCKDCLNYSRCGNSKACKHINFISDEHFEREVLPKIRESITPREERRLSRKTRRVPGIIYDDTTFDYYYIQMINNCLKDIREQQTAFLYTIEQVREVLSFEPTASVVLNDGVFYISLNHQNNYI